MLTPLESWPAVAQTLASSALVFMLAAAMEEALFRGYPLQTLLRSWPAWFATSLPSTSPAQSAPTAPLMRRS